MNETAPVVPTVDKKMASPPGIVPRNAETWFIVGISVLMVLVIALSGGKEKERKPSAVTTPQAQDPNEARIQEYRARIDEQARKLAKEQSDLAQTKEVLGFPPNPTTLQGPAYAGGASQPPFAYERPPAPEKSWIETEKEKREYQSLFASNVALSYREEAKTEKE